MSRHFGPVVWRCALKILLSIFGLLLLALISPATPVRAATVEIFSTPFTTSGRQDIHRAFGLLMTVTRHGDPEIEGRDSFLSTDATGFDNGASKIRIERKDGVEFNLSRIDIGLLYSGIRVSYRIQSEETFLAPTWDALVLRYSAGGAIAETRLSPWAPSDTFLNPDGSARRSVAPLQVNLSGVDWVEMTMRVDSAAFDPCNPLTLSRIQNPTLADGAQRFCRGESVPELVTNVDEQLTRNDTAFAEIRSITVSHVSPIPLPAGFWLLGSVLLIASGYGFRWRGRSDPAAI